jgi:hypothetical protein
MHREIAVWQVHGYWIYALYIGGRCVVIGRTPSRELAVERAQLA